MVILLPRTRSHMMIQENVEDIFEDMGFLRIRVQKLSDSAFLTPFARPLSSHTMHNAITMLLEAEVQPGLLTIQSCPP